MTTPQSDTPRADKAHDPTSPEKLYWEAQTIERELTAALARVLELEAVTEAKYWDKAVDCPICGRIIKHETPAPTYYDRPDKPGWWWVWDFGDEEWEMAHIEFPGAWTAEKMIWAPATPPPPPAKEEQP